MGTDGGGGGTDFEELVLDLLLDLAAAVTVTEEGAIGFRWEESNKQTRKEFC